MTVCQLCNAEFEKQNDLQRICAACRGLTRKEFKKKYGMTREEYHYHFCTKKPKPIDQNGQEINI